MSIIYSAVARENIILVEFTKCTGNFILMASQVLKLCTPEKKYARFQVQAYVFYTVYIRGAIYLCMCESQYPQRIAFLYLEEIRKLFEATFQQAVVEKAALYSLSPFTKILEEKSTLFNTPEKVDKISELKKVTEELVEVTRENLDKAIARGEKIEVLVEKTKTMSALSLDLNSNSKTLKNQMMWKNLKWKILIGLVLLLVIYFILVACCGGFSLSKCF